jgi:hypothetical protein
MRKAMFFNEFGLHDIENISIKLKQQNRIEHLLIQKICHTYE